MVRTDRPSPTGFLVHCSAQTSPLVVVVVVTVISNAPSLFDDVQICRRIQEPRCECEASYWNFFCSRVGAPNGNTYHSTHTSVLCDETLEHQSRSQV